MKNLAPIILFVYNRPWHTRQVLESLKANTLAGESKLYIFSDGAKQNADQNEISWIYEVRELIREKRWCGEVKIIEREQNLGLADSVITGVSEIIEKHEKVIVLEDDIVTGKYFLKFMNEALQLYENEKKVFGISGYKYPSLNIIKEPTYFLPIASSWSFGIWKDRWDKVNFNGTQLLKEVEDRNFQQKLDFGSNAFYGMLKDHIAGKNDSWAVRLYVSMFLENAYFLYPNKSLIENIGFDNSGVHCGYDDYYSKSKMSNDRVEVVKRNVELNRKVIKNIKKSFNVKFKRKKSTFSLMKSFASKILRRMNLI